MRIAGDSLAGARQTLQDSRMNPKDPKQTEFGLVRDMLASVDVLNTFDPAVIEPIVEPVRKAGRLMLTGEGSSRIFPAKNAIAHALRNGDALPIVTEAATQAAACRHPRHFLRRRDPPPFPG